MNRYAYAAAVLLLIVAPAQAVKPVTVIHTAEADFAATKAENVVVWSVGEITLGAQAKTVLAKRADLDAVTAVTVAPDGATYIGSAAKGLILRIDSDGAVSTVADLESVMVADLLLAGDTLYAATAGGSAGVYRIDLSARDKAVAEKFWSDDDATAVWAIGRCGETIYAATAPKGRLYAIDAKGAGEAIFTAKQKSLRSLLVKADTAYVGAGEDGLVYLIDLAGEGNPSRVLLDGEEAEIVALAADKAGNVYAAGTDVTSSAPAEPAETDGGKPAAATATKPSDTTATANAEKPRPVQQTPKPVATAARSRRAAGRKAGRRASDEEGNSVYRIDADGFVKVVAKIAPTIMDMIFAESSNSLLLGVEGGRVTQIDLDAGAVGGLAKLDPKQVTSLAVAADGTIIAGTTDPAVVSRITAAPAQAGTFTSEPLDARQIARWSSIAVNADTPAGTGVTVATRTGNVAEAEDATWSDWSDEISASDTWTNLTSPVGRFCQYRLTLKRDAKAAKAVPTVDSVSLVHQVGNLPPEVIAVQVALADKPGKGAGPNSPAGPMRYRTISAKAIDPNDDELRFDLYYRQVDEDIWIRWAKEADTPQAVWDTQTVPDGPYEVRVVASDAPSNPPASAMTDERVSRRVIVDNTPPRITEINAKVTGDTVKITGELADANRIAGAESRVDSAEKAVVMSAADGVFDTPNEAVVATLTDLTPGVHVITVKVADEFSNAAYATVNVTVGE